MAKVLDRNYDSSDLKELMDNTGGWAKNWDEVIRYIKGPGRYDSDFAKDEVPEIASDIVKLKRAHVPYTCDYRKVYEAITGKSGKKLPAPNPLRQTPTNPIELEDKYLKGLRFPASKSAALKQAKKKKAPPRVTGMIAKIREKRYDSMDMLLEAIGDYAWHD